MRRSNTFLLACAVLGLAACASWGPLRAADLHVRGLGWFGNRAAEKNLELLLGAQHSTILDANALEDASLVLLSALNEEGYLEPALTVETQLTDGRRANYPLDARLEPSLPRPLAASSATLLLTKGRRFALRGVTFRGLLAMTEKEARAFFR